MIPTHQALPGPASVLANVFGFPAFRTNQQEVCEAAIAGQDLLLVMPTGSGKSLCYQLPALVRGGTALVISPLIALMEDQSSRLTALGLRAGRIHSGLDRDASRAVCRQYLDGQLQFFFLAPERLRVPGFVEMLARRKPSLIAIDEAHCISQWGHDFRPDYRTLRQHIQALRPAPVVALTATATPIVQNDIVEQLGLAHAARFIHGFRRHNLAIEAVEVSKPRRAQFTLELLRSRTRRPAIVYAPTRKEAESSAAELANAFPCAAYHAGLDPQSRERIQRDFLEGRLEVIIATIAFGMGIDKPDVRTVIHTALPASLEGYYQEIGRAGRDGQPSRAILMHSFADRRTHDFFHQRDYPDLAILDRIVQKLGAKPRHAPCNVHDLRDALEIDADVFTRALEKLAAHGGAVIHYDGTVTPGHRQWRSAYALQSGHRQQQLEKVMRYAEARQCRMAALIEHFGDVDDAAQRCGLCDFCAPQDAIAQLFRPLTSDEKQTVLAVARALRPLQGMSTGKLHKQLFPRDQMLRDEFEALLAAMAQGGLATLEDAAFEKDGRNIAYRKVSLTEEGEELFNATNLQLFIPDTAEQNPPQKRPSQPGKPRAGKPSKPDSQPELTPSELDLEKKLKAWRLEEAKKNNFPAFRIFGDKTLRAIVLDRPRTMEDLLQVNGIGPEKAAKFGESICAICAAK
ncbi:MAG TPA: ATP-dependent DNA helicase RecQ [Acidobacteriaceae bacterium]|nr:ATP-dependent DNA helicase RecQ [Acidobacteriaceae bacterium]